jgi:hypothetical protein
LQPAFANPVALAVAHNGDVYIVDHPLDTDRKGTIYKFAPNGKAQFIARAIPDAAANDALDDKYAIDIAFDSLDNLYVLVPTLHRGGTTPDMPGHVDKITPQGARKTVASGFANPVALAIDRNDIAYVVDHAATGDRAGKVYKISPGGQPKLLCSAIPQATEADGLYLFRNLRLGFDGANNLLILEPTLCGSAARPTALGHVDKIAPDGTRTSLAPTFVNPVAMTVLGGDIYVAEQALEISRQGAVHKIMPDAQEVEIGSVLSSAAANAALYMNYRIALAANASSTTANGVPAGASLTVVSPSDSGITLQRGKTYQIRWTSAGLSPATQLKIALCNSLGAHWDLATGLADTGQWTWQVQGTYPDGSYRIRVSTLDDSVSDRSKNNFSIVSITAQTFASPTTAASAAPRAAARSAGTMGTPSGSTPATTATGKSLVKVKSAKGISSGPARATGSAGATKTKDRPKK